MSKTLAPQKLMIVFVQCTMFGDVLNLVLLCISNHNQDKEHANVIDGMIKPLVQVQMIKEQPMVNEVNKV